jgi:hypothetical protein
MKIIINSIGEKDPLIEIQLLDNPAVVRWFNKYSKLTKVGRMIDMPISSRPRVSWDLIQKHYQELRAVLDRLQYLPQPRFPKYFNRDQHWCNDIHNVFINALLQNIGNEDVMSINTIIHKLESFSNLTDTELYFKNLYPHNYLRTFIERDSGLEAWTLLTEEEMQYCTRLGDKHYDVVIADELLGKTYLTAFLQEEPPLSPSVKGIDATWGNIEIKLDSHRENIFSSERFQNWLKECGITSPQLEFPLGTVVYNKIIVKPKELHSRNFEFTFLE